MCQISNNWRNNYLKVDYMYPSFEKVTEAQLHYFNLIYKSWLSTLFTLQWWLLLFALCIPWVVWWIFVDKSRLGEILSFGLLISLIATTLDEVGSAFGIWSYNYRLAPLCVNLKSTNISILPVLYMFTYQFFYQWKPFIIASVLLAIFLSFVGEPFLIWTNIYKMFNWKYIYSFPIYIALALLTKTLIMAMFKKTNL
jgi:hypothetical protein